MAQEPSGVGVWSPKIRDEALVRKFVSQYGRGYVALSIQDGSGGMAQSVDPDENSLALAIWWNDVLAPPTTANPYGTQILTITHDSILRTDKGMYFYDIEPQYTANRGLLTAVWTYTVGGTPFQFTDHLQVLEPMPLYESLSEPERSVVEQVSWMFGDLYDSTEGGPHLIEEFQTHWNYERIAQMMRLAVNKMNFIGNYGNPPTTWGVGTASAARAADPIQITRPDGSVFLMYPSGAPSGGVAVPDNMSGLVVQGTYIEIMRHLRDSYTEIPNRPGMDVTYTDRRDYQQRWMANLQAEQQEWKQAVKNAKLSMLRLSRGSLLVAGGIYGGSAHGIFTSGTYAAQVRSWRMYPAAPAVMWGATSH